MPPLPGMPLNPLKDNAQTTADWETKKPADFSTLLTSFLSSVYSFKYCATTLGARYCPKRWMELDFVLYNL